jgi:hypothetical protein
MSDDQERRRKEAFYRRRPYHISHCADCGVGTNTLDEYYMVQDELWERAWAGRRKSWHGKVPGTEILCIGCLEKRIGRTLCRDDFTDVPANDPNENQQSDRLRDRLARRRGAKDE